MATHDQIWNYQDRIFGLNTEGSPVQSLSTGEALTLNATGLIRITILVGAGATVTYSMVDTATAGSHDSDTQVNVTADTTLDVEWPFYRISTAGGSARIAAV